jgi:MFS family permease
VLFSLPFILFSAWAGDLADRIAKKNIVVAVKSLEVAALLMGGYMLLTQNWVGILTVMFLMGVVSAVFSPAINGSIPENFTPAQVPRVNSLIKLASTAAILGGIAAAGFVLDLRPRALGGLLPDLGLPQGEDYGRWAGHGGRCGLHSRPAGFVRRLYFTPQARPRAPGEAALSLGRTTGFPAAYAFLLRRYSPLSGAAG